MGSVYPSSVDGPGLSQTYIITIFSNASFIPTLPSSPHVRSHYPSLPFNPSSLRHFITLHHHQLQVIHSFPSCPIYQILPGLSTTSFLQHRAARLPSKNRSRPSRSVLLRPRHATDSTGHLTLLYSSTTGEACRGPKQLPCYREFTQRCLLQYQGARCHPSAVSDS
jgi:hypothetical protein